VVDWSRGAATTYFKRSSCARKVSAADIVARRDPETDPSSSVRSARSSRALPAHGETTPAPSDLVAVPRASIAMIDSGIEELGSACVVRPMTVYSTTSIQSKESPSGVHSRPL